MAITTCSLFHHQKPTKLELDGVDNHLETLNYLLQENESDKSVIFHQIVLSFRENDRSMMHCIYLEHENVKKENTIEDPKIDAALLQFLSTLLHKRRLTAKKKDHAKEKQSVS